MTMEIRVAQSNDAKEWNSIISQSPHGTIFHEWDWLKIAEKHTQTKLFPLMGIKNGEPIGVFPLFFQKKGPVKMVFSPPPHAAMFYLGPIIIGFDVLMQNKRENIYMEFQKSVDYFIENDLHANYISISLPPSLQDPRPFGWSRYNINPAFDYITDLRNGEEHLFQSLDKKQRQDINRAKKRGISVKIGGREEIGVLIDLMTNRYEEQAKMITVPREYLKDIYDKFSDHITVFVTIVDGEVVTGLIDLHYKNILYSWIGNPKPRRHVSPSPNDLMAWEGIRYGCEQKFSYHVILGAAGNQRLHTYYASKFAPELSVRYLIKKSTYASTLFEKGYTRVLKPLRGKIKHCIPEK
jgi:hypothetical protein